MSELNLPHGTVKSLIKLGLVSPWPTSKWRGREGKERRGEGREGVGPLP